MAETSAVGWLSICWREKGRKEECVQKRCYWTKFGNVIFFHPLTIFFHAYSDQETIEINMFFLPAMCFYSVLHTTGLPSSHFRNRRFLTAQDEPESPSYHFSLRYFLWHVRILFYQHFCFLLKDRSMTSHRGHSHDHLLVGTMQVRGPQLAEDVQDSVATVVGEDSPDVSTRSPFVGRDAVWKVPFDLTGGFAAWTDGVAQILGFLIIQHFPLLVHCPPALKDPVNRWSFVDYKTWVLRAKGRERLGQEIVLQTDKQVLVQQQSESTKKYRRYVMYQDCILEIYSQTWWQIAYK